MSQLQRISDGLLLASVPLAGLVINSGSQAEANTVWGLIAYLGVAAPLYVFAERQRWRSLYASDPDRGAGNGRLSDRALRLLMLLGMPAGFFFVSWQYAFHELPSWITLVAAGVSTAWVFLTGLCAWRSFR
ncbi:MAG: hypothetical protein ACFB0Z_06195 [Candidatus Phaeomarinobacter sp.]